MKKVSIVSEVTAPRIGRAASLAKLAGALSHEVRIKLLDLLKAHPRSCGTELSQLLGMAHSIVFQHLKILREAGIIDGVVIGKRVVYDINHENLSLLKMIVSSIDSDVLS